jgi:hypothetical protein
MPAVPLSCQPIAEAIADLEADLADLQADLQTAPPSQKGAIRRQIAQVRRRLAEERRRLSRCVTSYAPGTVPVFVVDMIPNSQSAEAWQDSEPNLAVNPANPSQLVGSAFTPDPGASANAPVYISLDGGVTWTLNPIVPGGNSFTGTGDITVRFGGSSGVLYAGVLRGDSFLEMNILRTAAFASPTAMTVLEDRASVDQPFVQATTALGGGGTGNDRVYVGNNSFGTSQTATVDLSLDAATPPPPAGFGPHGIEKRGTSGQDGPPTRPAIHPDGTVYAAFLHWTAFNGATATAYVVVVRDDGWGAGAAPFGALLDPSDNLPGRFVTGALTIPWFSPTLGRERIGADLSLAVHPGNSSIVYVAWADDQAGVYTLHVRRSADRGLTWSGDLRTIAYAKNPSLAVNVRGKVGFLYQQVTGAPPNERWVTHLERTTDDWATASDDLILANVPADSPALLFYPYIGDYVQLLAVGKDFYGVFSANNTPDAANFPNGVLYQRNVDLATATLRDLQNNPVAASIDPFHFRVTELPTRSDLYVRDWTDSPTVADSGAEPSIRPYPFSTSDVWNRRSNAPGGFNANDQPVNEDPQNGAGPAGRNYAFTRVHRNAGGSVEHVRAHFLVSEFGTGSNYQNAGTTPDPPLNFSPNMLVRTMNAGYTWHLHPTLSTHLCLAVEISTPNDPIAAPTLFGRAPGWPTTDLVVINDNNKAQRNMGVYPTFGHGHFSHFAIVHNAATFLRDVTLRCEIDEQVLRRLEGLELETDGKTTPLRSGSEILLPSMQPGENRWVRLSAAIRGATGAQLLPIFLLEVVGGTVVNGFGVAPQPAPLATAARPNLDFHRSVLVRLDGGFGVELAAEANSAEALSRSRRLTASSYAKLLEAQREPLREALRAVVAEAEVGDPLAVEDAAAQLFEDVGEGDPGRWIPSHARLLHALDAYLTMLQKLGGDSADILQNVRWQRELFEALPPLRERRLASTVREASERFVATYTERRGRSPSYATLIRTLLPTFRETARLLRASGLDLQGDVSEMERRLRSLPALQKAHRQYLLKLMSLAP